VRKAFWAALLLSLGLAAPAWAQQRSPFRSFNPSEIKFTPIDTSKALAAPIPTQFNQGFNLKNFFSKISLTNFTTGPRFGTSNLPPPSSFPSTRYKSPLVPMMPIQGSQ